MGAGARLSQRSNGHAFAAGTGNGVAAAAVGGALIVEGARFADGAS
jgi:hypothetical protein